MKLDTFVICDDIRTEIGNKHSLIGTYDDLINFNATPDKQNIWPKGMKLGFFIRIILDENDINDIFSFKFITNYNSVKIELVQGIMDNKRIEKSKRITLAIVINNFKFVGPGEMDFQFDFYNENNELKTTLKIDKKIIVKETIINQ